MEDGLATHFPSLLLRERVSACEIPSQYRAIHSMALLLRQGVSEVPSASLGLVIPGGMLGMFESLGVFPGSESLDGV